MSDRTEQLSGVSLKREKIAYGLIVIIRKAQLLLEWLPVKKRRISMVSLTHRFYGDNMKYVAEYLKRQGNYEIAWITRYPEDCQDVKGMKVIKAKTLRHFLWQFTSRIVFSDDYLYIGFRTRKKQVYINTWHGGINYKRLGFEGIDFGSQFLEKKFMLQNIEPDYMVAGCRFFQDNMRAAFLMKRTVFLETGLPRNDLLHTKDPELAYRIKKKLGIEQKTRVLLYAPTFRNINREDNLFEIDLLRAADLLAKKTQADWIVLYRAHYFVHSNLEPGNPRIRNMSEYRDMQELMLISDCLISDYSSCMWDFIITDRPCICYAPDYDHYCKDDRGLTRAGYEMPYPLARNNEELALILEQLDMRAQIQKQQYHQKKMGSYEKGTACRQVAELVCRLCGRE